MNTNVTTSAVAQEATGVQCQRNVRGAVLRLAPLLLALAYAAALRGWWLS